MKRILIYILLFMVLILPGCEKSNQLNTEEQIVISEELKLFQENYSIENLDAIEIELIGFLSDSFSLYRIYDRALNKTAYTYEILDLKIEWEATKQFSEYDLFVIKNGAIYPLEFAIDYNYINSEELKYVIPETMIVKESFESEFGYDIIKNLVEKGIVYDYIEVLDEATAINMLSLNKGEYTWIQMMMASEINHLEDLIVVKYETESQKEYIKDRINARKEMMLNYKPNNPYYINAYKNEFMIEEHNLIIYSASELLSEEIKQFILDYLR